MSVCACHKPFTKSSERKRQLLRSLGSLFELNKERIRTDDLRHVRRFKASRFCVTSKALKMHYGAILYCSLIHIQRDRRVPLLNEIEFVNCANRSPKTRDFLKLCET